MKKNYSQYLLLKLFLQALIILIALINLISCSDYATAPYAGKINGKVHNIQGFPLYIADVSIGEYPITEPDVYGNFHLDTKTFPYDLEVEDFSTEDVNYILFKSLSTTKPQIVLPFVRNRQNSNTCFLWVKSPSTQGHSVSLTFASKEDFVQQTQYSYSNDSLFWIKVMIPYSKTSIEGKIVFILYTDTSGNCTYDNYGEKSVTLHTGTNDALIFSRSDIQFNPSESFISFNLILPDSLVWSYDTRAYIHFPGYSTSSDIRIYHDLYSSGESFIVPESLPSNFNIKICNDIHSYGELWAFSDQVKSVYTQPGTSVTLDNSKKISLISPEYGKVDVNDNTLFSFSDNTSYPGIYIININLKCIVTDKTSFRFSELNSRNIKLCHNCGFSWSVIKLSKFNSLDEFVSKPFIDDENFTSVTLSPSWYFRTAP